MMTGVCSLGSVSVGMKKIPALRFGNRIVIIRPLRPQKIAG